MVFNWATFGWVGRVRPGGAVVMGGGVLFRWTMSLFQLQRAGMPDFTGRSAPISAAAFNLSHPGCPEPAAPQHCSESRATPPVDHTHIYTYMYTNIYTLANGNLKRGYLKCRAVTGGAVRAEPGVGGGLLWGPSLRWKAAIKLLHITTMWHL